MVPPWVAARAWIGNASCILHNGPILIADDEVTILFLDEVRNMNDPAMPLPHELLLTLLGPIQECREHVSRVETMVRTICSFYIRSHEKSFRLGTQ